MRRRRRRRNWRPIGIFVIVLLLIAVSIYLLPDKEKASKKTEKNDQELAEVYYLPVSHFTDPKDNVSLGELKELFSTPSDKELFVGESYQNQVKKILGLEKLSANVSFVPDAQIIEKVSEKPNRLSIIPYLLSDSRVKALSVDNIYFWEKPDKYPLKNKETSPVFDQNKITKLTSGGDAMLSRHVATKIARYGDYKHPWLNVAGLFSESDLAFINLETPLSDRLPAPKEGMSFIAPTKNVEALKYAGIDMVALGNNHITNFGKQSLTDTITLLKENGLSYCGAGNNSDEAYTASILEKNGLKFAFINFNSIVGASPASDTAAGVAKLEIKPWAESDNKGDIERVKTVVEAAAQKADVVIASFHWGIEYKPYPIESQRDVAKAAIDSGADMIIGTHPHVVQGMEYSKAPIFFRSAILSLTRNGHKKRSKG